MFIFLEEVSAPKENEIVKTTNFYSSPKSSFGDTDIFNKGIPSALSSSNGGQFGFRSQSSECKKSKENNGIYKYFFFQKPICGLFLRHAVFSFCDSSRSRYGMKY